MKKLLFILTLFILSSCGEDRKPDKIAHVRIVSLEGKSDTVQLEYYNELYIWNNELNDGKGLVKAQFVKYFSIIGDIKAK